MSWSDILFGIGSRRLDAIALGRLDLFAVDSAVMVFVAPFGLFGALLFAATFLGLRAVMLRGARAATALAAVMVIEIALSDNALSSKEPSVFTLMSLIIVFRPPQHHHTVTHD